jgi:hypothetical protein
MSVWYLRSTTGSDSNNGTTWALAKATLAGALAVAAAGDTIYVSQAHAEAAVTSPWNMLGTNASPLRVVCGNDGAQPPTAIATSASISSTTTNPVGWGAESFYVYGVTFNAGAGGVNAGFYFGNQSPDSKKAQYRKCQFINIATGGNCPWAMGATSNNAPLHVEWLDCNIQAANASNTILITDAYFHWRGGAVLSGTAMTSLVSPSNDAPRSGNFIIEGVDLSLIGTTCDIVAAGAAGFYKGIVRNCILPTSWTGNLAASMVAPGQRMEMYNCDSGATNYRLFIQQFEGSVRDETTKVKTGGASDGTTPLSWKMATTSNANYPSQSLYSPEVVQWNALTGSVRTVTVDFLHDNVTGLNNNDIWLEVQYLSATGTPLGTFVDSAPDVLTAGSACASSSATWTTTGLTNPNKQKLVVTFTPQEKGFIHAKVHMGKASYTVYVDPLLQVT